MGDPNEGEAQRTMAPSVKKQTDFMTDLAENEVVGLLGLINSDARDIA